MTPPPFWRAENSARSFHYSARIGELLEQFDALIEQKKEPLLAEQLVTRHGFDESAATELIDYLARQRESTGVALPHRPRRLSRR
jgi:ATP-dependent Lhr-like helicase